MLHSHGIFSLNMHDKMLNKTPLFIQFGQLLQCLHQFGSFCFVENIKSTESIPPHIWYILLTTTSVEQISLLEGN